MIKKLPKSHGKVLGFSVVGDATKDDFAELSKEVTSVIDSDGSVCLLLDLTEFHHERIDAWGTDFHFGHEYHKKIVKMAMVGDTEMQKLETPLFRPFYAQEDKFFFSDADAWAWIEE